MQTIYLDISNKGVISRIQAKQGDVGRKFLAVITDSGVPHRLDSEDLFSVWYDGDSGEGNYSEIDGRSAFSINGNKIVVELVTQMLTNPGNGILSLVINDPTGQQIGLWNIEYVVEAVPGTDSPEADQYYTAFLNAVKEMAMAGVESPSFPGCYYRIVDGQTEWINPPMAVGEEYRTAERYNGKAVYARLLSIGALPNATKVSVAVAGEVDKFVAATLNATSSGGRADLINPTGVSLSFGHNHPGSPANSSWVDIVTNSAFSDYTAWLLVKYTKV